MTPVESGAPFDNISTYKPVESINAKLELTSVEARSELENNVCRLKGKTKAKEEIAAAGELFTLPPGLRPPAAVVVTANLESGVPGVSACTLKIATTGKVTTTVAIGAALTVNFDGVTFNLT